MNELAGLPALWCSKPGQVRKEAAIAITASAGVKARLLFVVRVITLVTRVDALIHRIKRAKITPVFVGLVHYLAGHS